MPLNLGVVYLAMTKNCSIIHNLKAIVMNVIQLCWED